MSLKYLLLPLLGGLLSAVTASQAAMVFADNFSISTLNSTSPAAPTSSSTAYQLFSSKSWNPTPGIGVNDLKFGITATTSGHIEAQALFSATPISLVNVGEYLELTVTFANTSGLFAQIGHVGFGLYNSGGTGPIAGGMNTTAVSGTTGVTGGAQGWQGYLARLAYNTGTHRIATRPTQSITTGNNQDLITEGSGSQSYANGVNLASAASTLTQPAGTQFTEAFRITLTAASTLQIESRLYSGANTNGTLLYNQTAAASGANFLTTNFDALCIGWRATTNTADTLIDIQSITVTTSVAESDPGNAVAGIFFQQQPGPTSAGATLTPALTVGATNALGLPATNSPITLSLVSGSGTLNGTLSQLTSASGIATFNDLNLSSTGTKQLRAAGGSFTTDSASFVITNSLVAFPGAEGAGANAIGGRGGDVYYVTTLTDNNSPGSLRYGISTAPAGGRTICFKVSGDIDLQSNLTINKPFLTIAGQTAPGDGITFRRRTVSVQNTHDVIIRFLRCRAGDLDSTFQDDSFHMVNATNAIADHLSNSWSVDECTSVTWSTNITIQWCMITESLKNSQHDKGSHGYGTLLRYAEGALTFHHNLYEHHDSRNPRLGDRIKLDFVNNVLYNWGGRAGYSGGNGATEDAKDNPDGVFTNYLNYVGNYLVAGPSSTTPNTAFASGATNTVIYQSSNRIDSNKNTAHDGVDTGWGMFNGFPYTVAASPYPFPTVTQDTAPEAYERVLAFVGNYLARDSVDSRLIGNVRDHTGRLVDAVGAGDQLTDYVTNNINGTDYVFVRGWPTLVSTPAPIDTDNDGMPDYWEVAVGLNPNLATDRNSITPSGYTELEVYLNWLAAAHALCDRNGQVDLDLQTATGGATNLTYSVATGINGSVSLLADGHTARFVAAANTNGAANFTFTATGNGATFGPVNYGILVTTTNAPVSNTAPTLNPIANQTVIAGTTINFTNSASDSDVPAQTLTFSLQNGPSGSAMNSSNGLFAWRPTVTQSPSTNLMKIIVADNGAPSLTATQSFTVFVLRPAQPSLLSASTSNGVFHSQVSGDVGPDYAVLASTNLVDWELIFTTNSPLMPFNWSDPSAGLHSQRFYQIKAGPPLP